MKQMWVITTLVLLIAILWSSNHTSAQNRDIEAGSASQLIPADAIKWVMARPGQDSSVLWGNPQTGAYGRFNRFAAGFEDTPHFHTRDLRVVVISGTMIVQVDGGKPTELGPGSYALISGSTAHTHSCKAGVPCVLFVVQDGANDTRPIQ